MNLLLKTKFLKIENNSILNFNYFRRKELSNEIWNDTIMFLYSDKSIILRVIQTIDRIITLGITK